MKVEIFSIRDTGILQRYINDFISDKNVIDIKFSHSEEDYASTCYCLIMYEE